MGDKKVSLTQHACIVRFILSFNYHPFRKYDTNTFGAKDLSNFNVTGALVLRFSDLIFFFGKFFLFDPMCAVHARRNMQILNPKSAALGIMTTPTPLYE